MRNNTTPLRILSVLLICLLFIGSIAEAQSVADLREAMDDAEDLVDAEKKPHETATAHLNKQIENFIRLHGHLVSIAINDTPATKPKDLIMSVTKIVVKLINTSQLTDVMEQQVTAIETQRGICNDIWADVVLTQTAYENAVDAFNDAVSPEERMIANSMPEPAHVNSLYLCKGPCSTPFETLVLATTSHQVFCEDPLHPPGYS